MNVTHISRHARPASGWAGMLLAAVLVANTAAADTVGTVSSAALLEQISSHNAPLILDVRRQDEFAAAHIPGAVNIPHTELRQRIGELAPYRDKPVVIHCESGRRAALGADILMSEGFSTIAYLEGHMAGWRDGGLPLARPEDR